MIDLETLSTERNAVVLSIGACIWENGRVTNKLYFELDVEPQKEKGRHISSSTLTWWNAQKTQIPEGNVDPRLALKDLMALMSQADEVWSRGSRDDVWLETLCEDFEVERSWQYNQWRDCRTLDSLGESFYRPDRPPVLHNALDDACQQAMDVSYILDKVGVIEDVEETYGFLRRLWLRFVGGK